MEQICRGTRVDDEINADNLLTSLPQVLSHVYGIYSSARACTTRLQSHFCVRLLIRNYEIASIV